MGFTTAASVRRAMTVDLKGQQRMITSDEEAALRRIEAKAAEVAREYRGFQQIQTEFGMGYAELAQSKQDLQSKLGNLRSELDALLAKEYGVDANKAVAFEQWQAGHQPFHWFVEFHSIMVQGGFDVVIGNPPYVEYSKVKNTYTIKDYETERSGNLFAFILERSTSLATDRMGWIIPISWVSTQRMDKARNVILRSHPALHISNYADRPSSLFDGVHQKLSILLAAKGNHEVRTTKFVRCYAKEGERHHLFNNIAYQPYQWQPGMVRKFGNPVEGSILNKIHEKATPVTALLSSSRKSGARKPLHLNQRLMLWVKCFLAPKTSSEFRTYYPAVSTSAAELSSVLNSSLFFWFWDTRGDCWHLTKGDMDDFHIDLLNLPSDGRKSLAELAEALEADLEINKEFVGTRQTDYEYYHRKSKPIIDKIDRVLAEHYGFTDEELDFIINYDIKYRMSRS